MTPERLIEEYSELDPSDQKLFDRRYRELKQFERKTQAIVRVFNSNAPSDKKRVAALIKIAREQARGRSEE